MMLPLHTARTHVLLFVFLRLLLVFGPSACAISESKKGALDVSNAFLAQSNLGLRMAASKLKDHTEKSPQTKALDTFPTTTGSSNHNYVVTPTTNKASTITGKDPFEPMMVRITSNVDVLPGDGPEKVFVASGNPEPIRKQKTAGKAVLLEGFSLQEQGKESEEKYSITYKNESGPISPWHNIPLEGGILPDSKLTSYNVVIERPKMTTAKFAMSKTDSWNPIKQSFIDGKPQFESAPIYWNYGMFPQTWLDPEKEGSESETASYKGDGNPVDVVEIGSKPIGRGSILNVKVLGSLALIDEGELDYKVIAIDPNDELAKDLNDITDLDRVGPHVIHGIREYFRFYKTPQKLDLNKYAWEGQAKNSAETIEIILAAHEAWKGLEIGKAVTGANTAIGEGTTNSSKYWLGDGSLKPK